MSTLHAMMTRAGRLLSKDKLSILIYHQVVSETDPMRPGDPDAQLFLWQMKLLRDHFNPLPLATAVHLLERGTLPANSVCVTFDDGYLNNLEVAQPILEKFAIPATVFVATAFSDGRNMWNDRLIDLLGQPEAATINLDVLEMEPVTLGDWESRRAIADSIIPVLKYKDYREREKLVDQLYLDNTAPEANRKMMSHEDVIELARKGVDIGAHTVDHPILKSLPRSEQSLQVTGSKKALEDLLGQAVTGFAYPNGRPGSDYDETTRELVRAAGFHYAVSTRWGISTQQTNQFELNRFTPWDETPARFHLRMLRNAIQ